MERCFWVGDLLTEIDLDALILKEIEKHYKTARRIREDLEIAGIEINEIRVGIRLKSLRKYNMVDFKVLDFPIVGVKPLAYKRKYK